MSVRQLFIVLSLCLITAIAFAWVGSDPSIRIVYPDAVGDADTCIVPVNVKVIQINTTNDIDTANYWLVEETGSDTYISSAEWATRVDIPYSTGIEDINRASSLVIAELGTDKLKNETYYYIVGIGKDLNGAYSSDSTLIPDTSKDGDANIADSAIVMFKTEGTR